MKRIINPLLAAVAAGLLAGCDQQGAGTPAGPTVTKLKVGFVDRAANDYWSQVRFGCDTAVVTSRDVELDFRTPAGRSVAEQNQALSNLVASGVQAIAISPVNGDEQTAILNAIPMNILVVCADNDAAQSRRAGADVFRFFPVPALPV